ncbi:MAG: AtpZ/AtpI family protein [Lachnospiraceae bacterium]|nr:AtpZ/AtpI family protein [Lachnospiraceae bacterium]
MLNPKVVRMMALITQVGISMLCPILMMLFLGVWLEDRFGIHLVLPFLLLGIAAGFRNCFILIKNALGLWKKKEQNNEKTDK